MVKVSLFLSQVVNIEKLNPNGAIFSLFTVHAVKPV